MTFLLGWAGYSALKGVISQDPFLSLRRSSQAGLSDLIGIHFKDVHLSAFHRGRLVTSARVDQLDVSKDRQSFQLTGIHDGVYATKAERYQYQASSGNYLAIPRLLTLIGDVRLKSKHMDLGTSLATFDAKRSMLSSNQPISGRLYDGQIKATNLLLNTKTEDYDLGPTEYHGTLSMLRRDSGDDDTPIMRAWDIVVSHTKGANSHSDAAHRYFTNATANDGEVLIKADLMDWDTKTDVITAIGNVFYFSGEADITGDKATIYHKERRIIVYGHVTMFVKPKSEKNKPPKVEAIPLMKPMTPDEVKADSKPSSSKDAEQKKLNDALRNGKSLREYPLVTVCHQIEYWYGKGHRHAHITGDPQGRQELPNSRWRYVWAFLGDYDGERDELTLESRPDKDDVRMKNSIGDDLTAKRLTVSTKDDADENDYDGDEVSGRVYSDSEEDPRGTKPKDAGGPNPGTKPPTKQPGANSPTTGSTVPSNGGGTKSPISS